MQVRRARTERLVLVPPGGGAPVELAMTGRVAGSVDSQDELAVSPDGAYLAWTTSDDERLHLRDADGHERLLPRYDHKMRFSPDGAWLAALTDVGRGDRHQLVAWELATGRRQPLVTATRVDRFEWVRGGLVVADGDELAYAPLAGDRRRVFAAAPGEQLRRFTATASRVVVVVETKRGLRVRSLDIDHPEHVRELGAVPGTRVDNAEQSPDGTRTVLATDTGLYVVDGDTPPRELSGRRDIHSLWFAPDGRLAYATLTGTTVLDGKHAHRLERATNMMRFAKGSTQALVASGSEVRAWEPTTNEQAVVATAPAGEALVGADRYRGGVVLWTGHETRSPPPSHRIVRVLRTTKTGTTELDRLDGDRAANTVPYIHSSLFAISADRTSVAYRNLAGTGWRVMAGSANREVAAELGVLSPTGRQLLANRADEPTHTVVSSVVDVATGAERALFRSDEHMSDAAFSADGNWLATTRKDHGQDTVEMIEVATGQRRSLPGDQLAWTARGLLVWGAQDMSLVSRSGQIQRIVDEPVQAGLSHVVTSATRAVVCFRAGSDGDKRHPGLLSIDLDAPARTVELDVPGCWTRNVWLSPDGDQLAVSGNAADGSTTDLEVTSAKMATPLRKLGDGYNDVVFGSGHRLAFVSHRGVELVDSTRTEHFDTDARVEGLHFAGDTVVFATDRDVIAWEPRTNTRSVLARAPEGQRILAMAAVTDGFVLATVE
jgi:WD40 repeat protein